MDPRRPPPPPPPRPVLRLRLTSPSPHSLSAALFARLHAASLGVDTLLLFPGSRAAHPPGTEPDFTLVVGAAPPLKDEDGRPVSVVEAVDGALVQWWKRWGEGDAAPGSVRSAFGRDSLRNALARNPNVVPRAHVQRLVELRLGNGGGRPVLAERLSRMARCVDSAACFFKNDQEQVSSSAARENGCPTRSPLPPQAERSGSPVEGDARARGEQELRALRRGLRALARQREQQPAGGEEDEVRRGRRRAPRMRRDWRRSRAVAARMIRGQALAVALHAEVVEAFSVVARMPVWSGDRSEDAEGCGPGSQFQGGGSVDRRGDGTLRPDVNPDCIDLERFLPSEPHRQRMLRELNETLERVEGIAERLCGGTVSAVGGEHGDAAELDAAVERRARGTVLSGTKTHDSGKIEEVASTPVSLSPASSPRTGNTYSNGHLGDVSLSPAVPTSRRAGARASAVHAATFEQSSLEALCTSSSAPWRSYVRSLEEKVRAKTGLCASIAGCAGRSAELRRDGGWKCVLCCSTNASVAKVCVACRHGVPESPCVASIHGGESIVSELVKAVQAEFDPLRFPWIIPPIFNTPEHFAGGPGWLPPHASELQPGLLNQLPSHRSRHVSYAAPPTAAGPAQSLAISTVPDSGGPGVAPPAVCGSVADSPSAKTLPPASRTQDARTAVSLNGPTALHRNKVVSSHDLQRAVAVGMNSGVDVFGLPMDGFAEPTKTPHFLSGGLSRPTAIKSSGHLQSGSFRAVHFDRTGTQGHSTEQVFADGPSSPSRCNPHELGDRVFGAVASVAGLARRGMAENETRRDGVLESSPAKPPTPSRSCALPLGPNSGLPVTTPGSTVAPLSPARDDWKPATVSSSSEACLNEYWTGSEFSVVRKPVPSDARETDGRWRRPSPDCVDTERSSLHALAAASDAANGGVGSATSESLAAVSAMVSGRGESGTDVSRRYLF